MDGFTGCQGPTGTLTNGFQGIIGPSGYQGYTGYTGYIGISGTLGLQGSIGETGSLGPQGLIGFEGPQGLWGETGPIGPQGINGTQGIISATGSTGTIPSAFQYLQKTTLDSSNATITLSNIPDCSIIKIMGQLYMNGGAVDAYKALYLEFNQDTGPNYLMECVDGYGTTVAADYQNTFTFVQTLIPYGPTLNATINLYLMCQSNTQRKILVGQSHSSRSDFRVSRVLGTAWTNTSNTISRMDFKTSNASLFLANSSITLYGVLK